jgi:membrane fusion protein, heavy metal efflux system
VPAARTHLLPALIAVDLLAAGMLAGGCSAGSDARMAADRATAANHPPATDTVELTREQLGAIRIEPVGMHSFSVERLAVGSIGFDEDPAIVQAESALVGAAATFERTRKELARVRALGASNGIAQKEIEQTVSDEQTAAAALRAARDAVRTLGKSDAQIEEIVRSGRIGASAGAHACAQWVLAGVAESDIPYVRAGQPVSVTVVAWPGRVFAGTVTRIYSTVDPDTHRVTIRASLADPRRELRPGMLASVAIRTAAPLEAVSLPATAVVREGDGSMVVWVTTDRQRFSQRTLKLGLQSDGDYQVLAGVTRGELAVTEGGVFLSNMLHAPPSD